MQKTRILLCFVLFSIIYRFAGASDLSEPMRTVEKIRGLSFFGTVIQKSLERTELRRYLDLVPA